MRALILIVSCVVVLAIVQASYLVVDAHTSGGPILRVSDDAHHTPKRAPSHHKAQAQALRDTREPNQMMYSSSQLHNQLWVEKKGGAGSTATPDRRPDERIPRRRLCEQHPEHPHCSRTDLINASLTSTREEKHRLPTAHTDRKPANGSRLSSVAMNVNDTIQQILELALDRQSKPVSGGHHQGAHHVKVDAERSGSRFRDRDGILDLALDNTGTETEVNIRRGHRKEFGYHTNPLRNIRLHRQGCYSDRDCGTGCCLESRNGKKMCRRGGQRSLGKRCSSSCMCQPDLQCWLREPDPRHNNQHRRVQGHCRHPLDPNLGPGHFLPTAAKPGVNGTNPRDHG